MILLDTSALYALASTEDPWHARAHALASRLADTGEPLVVHTYILCEAFALLHRRRGLVAALEVDAGARLHHAVDVDVRLHCRAIDHLRRSRSRRISLVDAVSFEVMREHGIRAAFAFDRDFEHEGVSLFDGT